MSRMQLMWLNAISGAANGVFALQGYTVHAFIAGMNVMGLIVLHLIGDEVTS